MADSTTPSTESAIALRAVSVTYRGAVHALRELSVEIAQGERVVVVGLSGAGKSTLLRTVNGLVSPGSGDIRVLGRDLSHCRGRALRQLRSEIGMIFQDHRLVRRLSVLENVLIGRVARVPLWRQLLSAWPADDVDRAYDALERVGLADRAHTAASDLSGGQQQRVGIARALAQDPRIVLADEPVASLDPVTSRQIMDDLAKIHADLGITMLVNLHYLDLASRFAERIIGLRDGRLVFDAPAARVEPGDYGAIYGRAIGDDDVLPTTAGAPTADAPTAGASE